MTASPPVSTLTPARCEACEEVQKAYLEFEISDEGATFALRNPDYEIAKHHALLAAANERIKDLSRTCVEWGQSSSQLETQIEAAEASLKEAKRLLQRLVGAYVQRDDVTAVMLMKAIRRVALESEAFLLRQKGSP